jgi:hypothetical protein
MMANNGVGFNPAIFRRKVRRRLTNPKGIESISPALAMQSPTLGDGAIRSSTLKGLNGAAMAAGAGDATPLGLEIILWDDYPG